MGSSLQVRTTGLHIGRICSLMRNFQFDIHISPNGSAGNNGLHGVFQYSDRSNDKKNPEQIH